MISGYFGTPGVGKTTLLTKIAINELSKIKYHRSIYKQVCTINFDCAGCYRISWSDLANFKIFDSLILIDEITLNADNRKFKEFSDEHRDFFILHRHLGCDIVYATQNFEAVDSKIRYLTLDLWYMTKSVVPFLKSFTCCKRIYRNIAITENNSELIYGYRFCNFLELLFVSNFKIVLRKPYYKYFDSFDELSLKTRPELISSNMKYIPKLTFKNKINYFISHNFFVKKFNILKKLFNKFRKRGVCFVKKIRKS